MLAATFSLVSAAVGHPGARMQWQESQRYPDPRFEIDRNTLVRWSESKGEAALTQYRQAKNARSVDGLPGLTDTPAGST